MFAHRHDRAFTLRGMSGCLRLAAPTWHVGQTGHVMTSRGSLATAAGLLLVLSLAGCTGPTSQPLPRPTAAPSEQGDCNGSIRFRGHNYRGHNLLNQQAPRGTLLGVGDVVGCGWRTASPVDRVKVYAVSGVDPSLAVKILGVDWQAVYVARGVGQSAWPQVLKK